MNSPRRRRVLQGLGGLAAGSLAGCTSDADPTDGSSTTPDGTTDAGATTATTARPSTTATSLPPPDGPTEHLDWFGPDVVGAQWLWYSAPPAEVPSGLGMHSYFATHPAQLDVDRLGEYGDRFDGDGSGDLGVLGRWTEYSIPWSTVDTLVRHRALGGYGLYSGSFDAAATRDALGPAAVRTESLEGGSVHVLEEDREDSISHSGVAVTDEHLALVQAPSEDAAARLARAFVETRIGERPRFHEESEVLPRVVDHLTPGFEYGGNWQPIWRREKLGDTTVSGPWVWSRRVVEGTVRQTTVTWQDESERSERKDASALAAEFEESEHSEDVRENLETLLHER